MLALLFKARFINGCSLPASQRKGPIALVTLVSLVACACGGTAAMRRAPAERSRMPAAPAPEATRATELRYFAVKDGALWAKPNVESTGTDGP